MSPESAEKQISVGCRVDSEILAKIDVRAERRGIARSDYLRRIIMEAVSKEELGTLARFDTPGEYLLLSPKMGRFELGYCNTKEALEQAFDELLNKLLREGPEWESEDWDGSYTRKV